MCSGPNRGAGGAGGSRSSRYVTRRIEASGSSMVRFIAQKTAAAIRDPGSIRAVQRIATYPVNRVRRSTLAHRGDVLRRDLEDHSYFAGLSKRIFILVQI